MTGPVLLKYNLRDGRYCRRQPSLSLLVNSHRGRLLILHGDSDSCLGESGVRRHDELLEAYDTRLSEHAPCKKKWNYDLWFTRWPEATLRLWRYISSEAPVRWS